MNGASDAIHHTTETTQNARVAQASLAIILTADSNYYLNVTGHSADSSTPRITLEHGYTLLPRIIIHVYNHTNYMYMYVYAIEAVACCVVCGGMVLWCAPCLCVPSFFLSLFFWFFLMRTVVLYTSDCSCIHVYHQFCFNLNTPEH